MMYFVYFVDYTVDRDLGDNYRQCSKEHFNLLKQHEGDLMMGNRPHEVESVIKIIERTKAVTTVPRNSQVIEIAVC